MDFGILLFIFFLISLIIVYFVDGYNQKLNIEKDQTPIASSFVNLFVLPKLRPKGTNLSRVTVYNDFIVVKNLPIYPGKYSPGHDQLDLETGKATYTHKPMIKFIADKDYRFGHIINRDAILSFDNRAETRDINLKYTDSDGQVYTLTIKKPYILTNSFKKLYQEIVNFVSSKNSN